MFSSTSLLESAAAAARVDPAEVDDSELMVMELDAVRAVSLLEAHVARVGAELEMRGTTDTEHGLRTGSWVAREAPTSPAAVRLRIRAGQTVARHWPKVEAAWLAGDVSWEHIRALLAASNPRVVEAIAGIQEPIIELAKGCGFEQWKTDVASLIRLLDQDGPDPKPGDGVNRLSWKTTLDGVLDLQGTLQHDLGLVLRTAVDRRADELFRAFTRDHEHCPDIVVPARAELCAMALIDLIRNGVAAEPGDGRARVEVTLIHHTDHDGSCEHDCGCGAATDTERDRGDGDDGLDVASTGGGTTDGPPPGHATADGTPARNDATIGQTDDTATHNGTHTAKRSDTTDPGSTAPGTARRPATADRTPAQNDTTTGQTNDTATHNGTHTAKRSDTTDPRSTAPGTARRPATADGTATRNGRFDARGRRAPWGNRDGTSTRNDRDARNRVDDRAGNRDGAVGADAGTRDRAGPNRTGNGDGTNRPGRGPDPGAGRDPSARAGRPGLTDLEGHPIRGEQAGVWSCVAERSVLIVDRNGVPLFLGRSRRLASPAQRKALAVRDGGCTFPGCEHPAMWTDAHHVTAWEHGGRTDLDQLVSLCRRHHGVAHRAGWVLTLGADGWTRWTTPSGITITGQRHHRRPHDPADLGDVQDGPARDGTGHAPAKPSAPNRPHEGPPTGEDEPSRWADTG